MGLRGKVLFDYANRNSRVGWYIFTLLALEGMTQAFLSWPKEGLDIPFVENPVKVPTGNVPYFNMKYETLAPIAGTSLWTLLALVAIKRQRFVVFPLLLASGTKLYYHQIWKNNIDIIEKLDAYRLAYFNQSNK